MVTIVVLHFVLPETSMSPLFSSEAQLWCANVHQLRSFVMFNLTCKIQYSLLSPLCKLGYV